MNHAAVIELASNFSSEYHSDVDGQFWGFNEACLLEFAGAVIAATYATPCCQEPATCGRPCVERGRFLELRSAAKEST